MSVLFFWKAPPVGETEEKTRARRFKGVSYWGLIVSLGTGCISLLLVVAIEGNDGLEWALGAMAGGAASAFFDVMAHIRDASPARPLRVYAVNFVAAPAIALFLALIWAVAGFVPAADPLKFGPLTVKLANQAEGVALLGVIWGFSWQYLVSSGWSFINPRK